MPFKGRILMTQRECADELGVCENTIQRYMNRGELEYLWIGGQRKITRHLWDKFLKGRVAKGPLQEEEE